MSLKFVSNENCITLCYHSTKTASESRFVIGSIEPMAAEASTERKIITDKLVVEKTGKTIAEWFEMLDQKGAKKLDHAAIFHLVSSIEGLKPLGEWNQNLLTTTYEWGRGIKERGQKPDGFEISVSKTISVPIGELYRAWTEDKLRSEWLPGENISIRKATENKSAHITWSDNKTSLSVDFYQKGESKSQVVVQHLKIPNSEMAAEMKEYWSRVLNNLKSFLE